MKNFTKVLLGAALLFGGASQALAYDAVYVRGDMNSWGAVSAWQFETTDGVNYTLNVDNFPANTAFKVADDSWGTINYGYSGTLTVGEEVTLVYNAGNMKISEEVTNATLTFNLTTLAFKISGSASAAKDKAGIFGTFNSWNSSDYVTEDLVDNCAVITVSNWTGGTFKALINGVSCGYSGGAITLENGVYVAVAEMAYGGDLSLPSSATGKEVTFTIDIANSQIKAVWTSEGGEEGGGEEGGEESDYTLVLSTEVGGWTTDGPSSTTVTDNCISVSVESWEGGLFKLILNGVWYGSSTWEETTVANGEWYTTVNQGMDNNFRLPDEATGKSVTFTMATDTKSIKAVWASEGEGGGEEGDQTAGVAGEFNGWSETANVTSTLVDNCATITVANWEGGEFKILIDGAYYCTGVDEAIGNDAWTNVRIIEGYGNNLYLDESATGKTVTFTIAVDTKSFKATWENEGGGEEGGEESDLYLLGDVNGNNWSTSKGVAPSTKDGQTYTWNKVTIDNGSEGYGFFSFATTLGANWDAVNSGNRYGAAAEGTQLASTASAPITLYAVGVDASACKSWKVAAGKYRIVVDLQSMSLSISESTAIDTIEAADAQADAVYYTLQGVRVNNPVSGIFVKVAGGKAAKVIL